MEIDVGMLRSNPDRDAESSARIRLRIEALRWSGEFTFEGCADPALARLAGRAYGWYLGYLLYANAPLVRARATRSMIEHSQDGGRAFLKIRLEDGAGAPIETVTVEVRSVPDPEAAVEEASAILRERGMRVMAEFAAAPMQAAALLADRPFYTLPRWLDGALQTARHLEAHALPRPLAAEKARGGAMPRAMQPRLRAS